MLRIETFHDLYDAMYFIETHAEESKIREDEYFHSEITLIDGNRYRVTVDTQQQTEMDV